MPHEGGRTRDCRRPSERFGAPRWPPAPWLVIVAIAASLALGLVQAIVPQDSADRLGTP
jgi:hypothetical protein